jgi:DNA-binding transcriptional LysR family regulator
MNKIEALKAFCLTAEHLNFSRAAKEMGISATMVSRYVKQLEQELGCLLLKRNTRKVFLTEAGEQYRNYVKPLLKKLHLVDSQMRHLKTEPSGELRISATAEFGGQYLAPLIALYRERYPQVKLNIRIDNAPIDLFDDKTDLAIRVAPSLSNASYIAQKVGQSRLSLWASPTYLTQFGYPTNLEDLSQHQLLFFDHSLRKEQWLFMDNNERRLIKYNWAWSSNSGKLLNEAAANGQGIIQAPSYSVASYVASNSLIEILPQFAINDLQISAMYPHRYELSARVKTFIEMAKTYFQEHPVD